MDVHGLLQESDADLGIVWGGTLLYQAQNGMRTRASYPCGSIFNLNGAMKYAAMCLSLNGNVKTGKTAPASKCGLRLKATSADAPSLVLIERQADHVEQKSRDERRNLVGEHGYINDDHQFPVFPQALIPLYHA